MRSYRIEDDGDEVHLSLFQGEMQVGGALFPEDGDGAAKQMAEEIGKSWGVKESTIH